MKKVSLFIKSLCITSVLLISGCESGGNGATFDINDESSFDKLAKNLNREDTVALIKNMELIAHAHQGEHKLHGMTLDQITQEASNIKEWLKKQNQEFLKAYIAKLQATDQTETYLHITENGRLYEPKSGYIYEKSYSIDELNEILKYGGDFEAYSKMKH